ncbi:MAG TPA: hypothetical protein ACFCUY_10905 [Xenococcaceae cyanobacterium]
MVLRIIWRSLLKVKLIQAIAQCCDQQIALQNGTINSKHIIKFY